MRRNLAAIGLFAAATFVPVPPASAQDLLGGALLGGTAGAIIGGAVTGKTSGAVVGGIIGATTGAIIAQEAQRNQRGYYAWRSGCYLQRRDGTWIRVKQRYCY